MKTLILIALLLLTGLASPAQAAVPAAHRALIIVNELDSTGIPELAPLYATLEHLTIGLPTLPVVRNNYGRIVVLNNGFATLTRFRNAARQLALDPSVGAIDLILALHGRDGKLKWADGTVDVADMTRFLTQAANASEQTVVNAMMRKFRMVYNTSCFGASHRAALNRAGFDVVVGSVGVNANAEAEYPAFLAAWNLGQHFYGSFAATNNDVALAATDGPLRAAGFALNNFLRNVNSRKVFTGNLATNINSDPR